MELTPVKEQAEIPVGVLLQLSVRPIVSAVVFSLLRFRRMDKQYRDIELYCKQYWHDYYGFSWNIFGNYSYRYERNFKWHIRVLGPEFLCN